VEDYIADYDSPSEKTTTKTANTGRNGANLVENFYNSLNQRDFTFATNCFSDNFTYEDSVYMGVITNQKEELQSRFLNGVSRLPPKAKIIIEDIACDDENGKVGVKWHVEKDSKILLFTRGCSFYTIDEEGKIVDAFKASEMLIKTDKRFADALVSNASKFSGATDSFVQKLQQQQQQTSFEEEEDENGTSSSSTLSTIEQYYNAWNSRDMELALSYFDEDCTVQTEDPVFVGTIRGKDELRAHLLQNADSLPSSAKIMIDDIAVDRSNGNYGVRWHLEVNGYSLPGLRGCSFCTSDVETSLLKCAFDVTEAPVKIPRVPKGSVFSTLMSVSSRALWNR